jgi:hypothetical protein
MGSLTRAVTQNENAMTKLEAIEEEIRKLSPGELAQLRDWMSERDWEEWNEQIARDSASGKLDSLFTKAVADHEAYG